MKSKTSIFLLALLLLLFSQYAYSQMPEIKQDQVVFLGGKILRFEAENSSERVHIVDDKYEEPVLIEEWKRLVLVKHKILNEDISKQIVVYDYNGEELSRSPFFFGKVVFLRKLNRIMLFQTSAHYMVNKSFLLDSNGKLVKELTQGQNVFDFSFSKDERLLWLLSDHIKEDGRLFVRVQIFDSNGISIKNITSYKEQTINVNYSGKKYGIFTPQPKVPG